MSPDLIDAYKKARYQVDAPGGRFTLTVDLYSKELADTHALHRVDSSAFITAWNPHSQPCPPAENEKAQTALVTAVEKLGYTWLPGVGTDPALTWEGEPSLLILGINENEALTLGRRFGQNAIIMNDAAAIPLLRYP